MRSNHLFIYFNNDAAMKSNVTLISKSRDLFGVTVRQETKTGNLNLSDLQLVYDVAKKIEGWPNKAVQEILSYNDNRERIYYILYKQGIIKTSLNEFMEFVDQNGITKTLKILGVYSTRGRGINKTTTCNPYIWVLIAMEMNPRLYAEVIGWLTDKLVLNRIEAGQMHKELALAASTFPNTAYGDLAIALNHVVFGKHEPGIRNTGTVEELKELQRIESNLAFSIEAGFIKSFGQLMEQIRDIWRKKNRTIAGTLHEG